MAKIEEGERQLEEEVETSKISYLAVAFTGGEHLTPGDIEMIDNWARKSEVEEYKSTHAKGDNWNGEPSEQSYNKGLVYGNALFKYFIADGLMYIFPQFYPLFRGFDKQIIHRDFAAAVGKDPATLQDMGKLTFRFRMTAQKVKGEVVLRQIHDTTNDPYLVSSIDGHLAFRHQTLEPLLSPEFTISN